MTAAHCTKPTDPVHCPACRWQGTIGDTDTPEDSIVCCPECHAYVRAGRRPDAPATVQPTQGA